MPESSPLVLVVEHEEQCPPGWLGEWLVADGAVLDLRRPYLGDPLPQDLDAFAGMVVLGGEMGAYDDAEHPWLPVVKRLVVQSAEDGKPVLGVCLGHQLAAVALGGRVERNAGGQQIGVFGVGWTEAAYADPLFADLARRGSSAEDVPAAQWNNDVVVDLPEGGVPLARMPGGELQAARLAPTVWGVQWHPEAGEQIIAAWVEHDRDDAVQRRPDIDERLADVAAAEPRLKETWPLLARSFLAVCAPVEAARG